MWSSEQEFHWSIEALPFIDDYFDKQLKIFHNNWFNFVVQKRSTIPLILQYMALKKSIAFKGLNLLVLSFVNNNNNESGILLLTVLLEARIHK